MVRLFIDFDGTITTTDVGNEFFRTFGGPECEEIIAAYHGEAISARECFLREAARVKDFSPEAFVNFLSSQEVDATFEEFVAWSEGRGIPLMILSDGLDGYIRPLLDAHGLGGVSFASNRMMVRADGESFDLAFPHENAECDRCACCKRNLLLTGSGDQDVIVYVGDGYSDRCPAGYADVVFARGSLQTYCQKENISYSPFRDFRDVRRTLERLISRRALRMRTRARLRRRDAFQAEA